MTESQQTNEAVELKNLLAWLLSREVRNNTNIILIE